MNTDNERLELIEHFLQDELSATEKTEKENLLKEDPEFRAAFNEYQLLVEGIKYSGRNDLLSKFREIESKNYDQEEGETPQRSLRKYYIGMAASIGFLLLSYVGVQEFYFKTPGKIGNSFFEPYPTIVGGVTRSAETERTDLEQAMALFEGGKYQEAIEMYKKLNDPENRELIDFYMANAYQAEENYEASIDLYKKLIEENSILKEQSQWYLALAYLQTDRERLAEAVLIEIKNSGGDYAEKAEKVLNSVN